MESGYVCRATLWGPENLRRHQENTKSRRIVSEWSLDFCTGRNISYISECSEMKPRFRNEGFISPHSEMRVVFQNSPETTYTHAEMKKK
jgi:hypothetical protein